jgi:hypothetical protein
MPIGILAETKTYLMAVPTTNKVELLFWEDGAFNWWDPDVDGPQTVITSELQQWVNTVGLNPANIGYEPQIVAYPNSADGNQDPVSASDGWIVQFPSPSGPPIYLTILWRGGPILAGTGNGFYIAVGNWDFTSSSNSGYGIAVAPSVNSTNRYVDSYTTLTVYMTSSVDNGKEFISIALRAGDRAGSYNGSNGSEVSVLIFKDQNGEWCVLEDLNESSTSGLMRDADSGITYAVNTPIQILRNNYSNNSSLLPLYLTYEGAGQEVPGQKIWYSANEYLYYPTYMVSGSGMVHAKITDSSSEALISTHIESGRKPVMRYSVD